MKNIRALDGLRCIAVLLVLVDHWSEEKIGLPLGPLGVSMFFVLSGFLISSILLTAKTRISEGQSTLGQSLKLFYIRRTLRIFPLYYLVVLAAFLFKEKSIVENLAWHVSYTSNIAIAFKNGWLGISDHLWSLSVEEQFYLFFPIVILCVPFRYLKSLFISFIFLALAHRLFFALKDQWIPAYVLMTTSLDAFGLGAMLALYRKNHQETLLRKLAHPLALVVSICAYLLVLWAVQSDTVGHTRANIIFLRLLESQMAFFMIVQILYRENTYTRFLELGPVVYLGKISYGLYILHNFVFNHYHPLPGHPVYLFLEKTHLLHAPIWIKTPVLISITIGLASLSWFFFEKPLLRLKEKYNY